MGKALDSLVLRLTGKIYVTPHEQRGNYVPGYWRSAGLFGKTKAEAKKFAGERRARKLDVIGQLRKSLVPQFRESQTDWSNRFTHNTRPEVYVEMVHDNKGEPMTRIQHMNARYHFTGPNQVADAINQINKLQLKDFDRPLPGMKPEVQAHHAAKARQARLRAKLRKAKKA